MHKKIKIFFLLIFLLGPIVVFHNRQEISGFFNECLISIAKKSSPFILNSHNVNGDLLVIDYEIQYPGITKIRIYDQSNKLLWRNQYVNDVVGKHQIVLKYKNMSSGVYKFELEYKKELKTFIVEK